jgi:CBS domain-containing protein
MTIRSDDESEIPQAEPGSWPAWKPVSSLMRNVPRVSLSCTRDEIQTLFHTHDATDALVVDGDGKPMGLVRRGSLQSRGATAEALLMPVVFTLNEAVPLSLAAALMAAAGVDRVPIVSSTQGAVGLVTSRDLLEWIATQAGHRISRSDESIASMETDELAGPSGPGKRE